MYRQIAKLMGRNTAIIIETASHQDVQILADIHRNSFNRGWSDGELQSLLTNQNYFCLIAREKNDARQKPEAFILIRVTLDEAEIITIATHKKARRNGFARHLMDVAMRKLEADRVKKLFLEVDQGNLAALSLYQNLGFIKIGERTGYYSSGSQGGDKPATALVMQRELG